MLEVKPNYDWKEILKSDLSSPSFGYVIEANEFSAQLWVSSCVFALLTNNTHAVQTFINNYPGEEGLSSAIALATLMEKQTFSNTDYAAEEIEAIMQGIIAADSTKDGKALFWSKYYDIWENEKTIKPIKAHMDLRQSMHKGQAILSVPLSSIGERRGLPTRILYKDKNIYNDSGDDSFSQLIAIMEKSGFSREYVQQKLANSAVQRLLYAAVEPDFVDDVMRGHNAPTIVQDASYFTDNAQKVAKWVYDAGSREVKDKMLQPFSEFLMTDFTVPMTHNGQSARMMIRISIGRHEVRYDPEKETVVGDYSHVETVAICTEVFPDLTITTTESILLQLRQQALDFVKLTGLDDAMQNSSSGGGGTLASARLMRLMLK